MISSILYLASPFSIGLAVKRLSALVGICRCNQTLQVDGPDPHYVMALILIMYSSKPTYVLV